MEIRISADGDGRVAYLESLSDWLRAESELRGRVALVNSVPQEGELGTLTVLASALKSWLSRPRGTDVHIVRLESDKAKVEIDAHRLDRDTAGWLIRKALGESVQENEQ